MKLKIMTVLAMSLMLPIKTFALDSKLELKTKLKEIQWFSASVKQEVFDEDGNALQESVGKIRVKRPNLVHWQTIEPEESLVLSDGETLWLYEPFIEEVTAFSLDEAVVNTPILLLTSNNDVLWNNYTVEKHGENGFTVLSKDSTSRIKRLDVFIDSGQITQFDIYDATGQKSLFKLAYDKSADEPKPDVFKFVMPEGVSLSDQRN